MKEEIALLRRNALAKWLEGKSRPPKDKNYFWQVLNNKTKMGESAAMRIEQEYGMPEGYLVSPSAYHLNTLEAREQGTTYKTAISSYTIPVFGAVASMGSGAVIQVENDAVVDHIRLTKQFVDANMRGISSPSNLAVLSAIGNSMEPTFKNGDILIVDKGASELKTDSIYVFERFGELFIKRIDRRFDDGAVVIKSDNPLHGESIVPSGEKDSLHVLGRVVFAWNGRQL